MKPQQKQTKDFYLPMKTLVFCFKMPIKHSDQLFQLITVD